MTAKARRTRSRAMRALSVVAILVPAGVLLFFGWRWLDDDLARRALAARLQSGELHTPRLLEEVAVLPGDLKESSGIAVSRSQPGVLWSHNDSGDRPNLYAVDISGKLLAKITVANALARDWEDITLGPCPAGMPAEGPLPREGCLYIADTGDNDQILESVTIYVVVEPRIEPGIASYRPAPARWFHYRYPNGPNDAEALAILPNGDLTIVSKGRTGSIDFFGLSATSVAGAIESGDTVEVRFSGNTGIAPDPGRGRLVTGAALSPDATTLAVRTYYQVYFFGVDRAGGQNRFRSIGSPCFLGDAEPQGEAIDYLDANTLLLTSETSRGRRGTIHRLQC
jgi:hypothetical protein